jgi:hypothetical protein
MKKVFSAFLILLVSLVGGSVEVVEKQKCMMNFSSLKQAGSQKRNFFVACLVFLFGAFFGIIFFIFRESVSIDRIMRGAEALPGNESKKNEAVEVGSDSDLRSIVEGTRSLAGVVQQVITNKDGNILQFSVRAFVIDRDAIGNGENATEKLPMIEKSFMIAIGPDTVMKMEAPQEGLLSGDFVRVETKESLYDTDRFSAISIEKLGSTRIQGSED